MLEFKTNRMSKMELNTSPEFESKFASYPDTVLDKMHALRALIHESAMELPEITKLEETLKWGEPSFLTKNGSTLRIDWKPKNPDQYAVYFKCTSRLVETFKNVFGNLFDYEKNRAIVFQLDQKVPTSELKKCIKAALLYHMVKEDIRLGL